MSNELDWKKTSQRLDLAGLNERIAKREQVQKEQRQSPQQVATDSLEARERGFRSAFAGGHRQIDLKKLRERDPAAFAFLTRNTSPETA